MKQQITFVSVPVSNQDAAKKFYSEVMGFAVEFDVDMDANSRWVTLRPPGSEASITLVSWFPNMPAGSMQGLVLAVDDVVAYREQLVARGLVVDKIIDAPWGKHAMCKDPDGNGWVLNQPLDR